LADKTRTNPAARRSITSHPLFPVIVVLWCGALFGMASLAIRTELIESAVVATGMDSIVPMTAPPLGKTARILFALLATGLGCLVGLVVMRRFSKPRVEAPVRRRTSSPAAEDTASPVSLFGGARRREGEEAEQVAEVVEEVEEAPAAPVGRRRRFRMAREQQPEAADPVPSAQILNVADLDPDSFEPDADTPRWVRTIDQDAAASDVPDPSESRTDSLFDSYARRLSPVASVEETVAEPGFELLSQPNADDGEADPRWQAGTDVVRDAPEQGEPAATHVRADMRPRARGSAAERIANAPLDDLSPVELLERLALTIERRRAALRAAAEAAATAAAAPEPAPAPQEDTARPFSLSEAEPAPPLPAALRPVDLDSDAHQDEPLPGYVPPRHIGLNATPVEPHIPAPSEMTDEDDVLLAEGYSSLRNLSRPAIASPAPKRPFASSPMPRFDNPAAAGEVRSVFPFPAQSDPAAPDMTEAPSSPTNPSRAFDAPAHAKDADAELRAALATLQRMSGAA
jgi:hypothetical protein